MKNNRHLYKRVGISISLLVFVFSSISSDLSQKPKDVVLKFNSTFNSRSLEELKETLSPTLTVINEEGEIVAKNREDYFENAIYRPIVFGTKWKIKTLKSKGNKVYTFEEDSSMLNQFLYNQPLKFNYEYTIKNNQIVCLKYDSIPGYYKVKKRAEIQMQKLSVWAYKNHPALLERELTTDILKKLIELYTEQKK